jgi:hypothetical protein
MNRAALLLAPLVVVAALAPAQAEDITLTCSVGSESFPSQAIYLQIKDGRISYGSDKDSLVDAESIEKSSLVVKSDKIAFKQLFASTRVAWEWKIDRSAGKIEIRYVNTENGKPFLTKKGTCS